MKRQDEPPPPTPLAVNANDNAERISAELAQAMQRLPSLSPEAASVLREALLAVVDELEADGVTFEPDLQFMIWELRRLHGDTTTPPPGLVDDPDA